MLTPVFHPNIAPHAICIGDHWSAGEPLAALVARIGELLAYQSYNTKSPLNGEAARWTSEHLDELPLDPVSMFPEETTPAAGERSEVRSQKSEIGGQRSEGQADLRPLTSDLGAEVPPAPPPAAPDVVVCPGCSGQLRVLPEYRGRQVRCPRCQNVFIAFA
jgi:predicted Zn finger-like uncharacterized protein